MKIPVFGRKTSFLWGSVLGLIILGIVYMFSSGQDQLSLSNPSENLSYASQVPPEDDATPQPTGTGQTTPAPQKSVTPTIHVPGPVPETEPVERAQFDTTVWNVYENPAVGIRFRYPAEWGEPVEKFLQPCQEGQNPPDCVFRGYDFKISFPNSGFRVGGTRDIPAGKDAGLDDFSGTENVGWAEGCSKYPRTLGYMVIHCQETLPVVHLTAIGTYTSTDTSRVMLINTPEKVLGGIALYGSFLSEPYKELVNERKQYYFDTGNVLILDPLKQVILERRLDGESMRTFDLFEKVFETVEVL